MSLYMKKLFNKFQSNLFDCLIHTVWSNGGGGGGEWVLFCANDPVLGYIRMSSLITLTVSRLSFTLVILNSYIH